MDTHVAIFLAIELTYIPFYFIASYFDNLKPQPRIQREVLDPSVIT